jgi:hypothetical protein
MATATYAVTRSDTDLEQLWRKVQAGVVEAFNFGVEEWNLLNKLTNFDVDWSAREITLELDVLDDYGTASIIEGGKESRPSSPAPVTATITWILLNKRFTISKTAQYISEQTPKAMLENQLKFQSKKAVQGIRRKVGDMFYGFSTGTVAIVTGISTDAVTLQDLYGISGLGATTDDRQVIDLFRAGDYVAFLNPSGPALRTSGIALIDSVTEATNVINGTTFSDVSTVTASDLVVFANNLENTTMASGTERSQNLVGLLDAMTSVSVHGVSNSSTPRWNVAGSDTAGGRFTGIKLRKMKQAIANNGGVELDTVIWSNGVENDVVAQLQAGLRFSDAFNMELDGKPTSKGVTFFTSRRVPDGYVFGFAKKAINKMTLLPEPGKQAFDDGHKLQDDSGLVFSLDYPCAMVYKNRAAMYYLSGVTEQ